MRYMNILVYHEDHGHELQDPDARLRPYVIINIISTIIIVVSTHTITQVYCRRETLGIIFQTCSTFCKESLGIIFPTFPTFPTFCKESTGYPALDPTANKYLSGSGWEISVLFFMFSFYYFYVFRFFFELLYLCCCYMRLFGCKCKSLNKKNMRKYKNNRKKHTTNRTTQRKTEIQKYRISSSRPDRE